MNDWDSIEKIVNTLPQWDIIKLIMGIQEELKCAKEDNLYQLRQNKNLQNRIDKVLEYVNSDEFEQLFESYANFNNANCNINHLLKESGEE